jgi:hypothetical protein
MDQFTVVIRLAHKPHFGYVYKRGKYVEMLPLKRYKQKELLSMPTYFAPLQKYNYLFSMGYTFHSVDSIATYLDM